MIFHSFADEFENEVMRPRRSRAFVEFLRLLPFARNIRGRFAEHLDTQAGNSSVTFMTFGRWAAT